MRGLGGRRPVEMVATTAGAEAVLDLIGRLEHGVFA
ncbi:antitoxin Xre/MbcA/ParS toxin-binding domain-containing protein [Cobetia marina]